MQQVCYIWFICLNLIGSTSRCTLSNVGEIAPTRFFLFVNVYKKIAHKKNYIGPPGDFFNPKSKQKKYIQHKNNMLKPKPFSPILIIFTVSQKNFINCIEHTVSHTKLVTYHTHLITMWIIPHSLWPSQFSKQPNTIVSHLHFFIHFP